MAGFATAATLADLARMAQAQTGPLAPPVKASGPLDAATARELLEIGRADIKRRFQTGTAPDGSAWRPLKYSRPSGAGKPLQDTGRLMASIQGRHTATELVWFTAEAAAGLMHYGGTIVPRRAKFLAIPLTREAKRAGSPRRLRGTKVVPLFARLTGGRMVGHFLLCKKAVVPARPFMGLSERAQGAIAEVLAERAAKQWQAS